MKTHISQQVDYLDEHQRQSFLSLHNFYSYKDTREQYSGIIRTNGLPIEDNGVAAGIFLEACRINHDCHNNAQKYWNKRIKRHTVHALREIAEGEEITIYYLALDSSREFRRQKLQDRFGFRCSCRFCSLGPAESQKDDRIMARIDQLDDLIGKECNATNFSLQTLRYVDERVRLYDEQRPGSSGVARAYFDAAQIAITNGDLARGSVFAERAVEGWRIAHGSDCDEVVNQTPIIHDPTKLAVYGLSTRWKTSLNETLPQLDSRDFEDWLWRREKPKASGRSTRLRNRDVFPSFADLPVKSRFESGPLESFGDRDRPSHHWCLLAEIVGSMTLHHLELQLADVDHKSFPLHFNTAGRGNEIESTKIQEGYTVAVLYAKRRAFMYGDPGIDHVDPRMLKVFPVSLSKLLELSDRTEQFPSNEQGIRTCNGCGKKAALTQRCGKCSLVWYCNTDCQKVGWMEKGHKGDCNLLKKNPDLRELLIMQWDALVAPVHFPLTSSK